MTMSRGFFLCVSVVGTSTRSRSRRKFSKIDEEGLCGISGGEISPELGRESFS